MTMKLAKASAKLLGVLAMALCVALGAWAQGKSAGRAKSAKGAKAARVTNPAATPSPAAARAKVTKVSLVGKRDPFVPLISTAKGPARHLPPGKAGLEISTVQVEGVVRSPGGMIAVVSNPEERVYFIREGDRLYDGEVEKIGMDGVTFRESTKDAFGKPVERVVTKRIYASAGEQQ
jgi:Tfp pilus assembly protein PilP